MYITDRDIIKQAIANIELEGLKIPENIKHLINEGKIATEQILDILHKE